MTYVAARIGMYMDADNFRTPEPTRGWVAARRQTMLLNLSKQAFQSSVLKVDVALLAVFWDVLVTA
jgi:hypothetical protein